MKLCHIVGTRPNLIKLSSQLNALKDCAQNIVIDTNQHYDYKMSKVFYDQLEIPPSKYNLNIKPSSQAKLIGESLIKINEILNIELPDCVVIYGDVNSSLAGAIASNRLNIPLVHIEAGGRSFDIKMAEEQNRIFIDRISTKLICIEESHALNLENEGLENYIITGNNQIDTLIRILNKVKKNKYNFSYYLCTLHRPFNVDDPISLNTILNKLNKFNRRVIFPVHPRLKIQNSNDFKNIDFVKPMDYIEFISTMYYSSGVISDSGGVQCECSYLKIPMITLRNSTEHLITLKYSNVLCSVDELSENKFKRELNYEIPSIWDGEASIKNTKIISKITRN